jgi:hypothetical protein
MDMIAMTLDIVMFLVMAEDGMRQQFNGGSDIN